MTLLGIELVGAMGQCASSTNQKNLYNARGHAIWRQRASLRESMQNKAHVIASTEPSLTILPSRQAFADHEDEIGLLQFNRDGCTIHNHLYGALNMSVGVDWERERQVMTTQVLPFGLGERAQAIAQTVAMKMVKSLTEATSRYGEAQVAAKSCYV